VEKYHPEELKLPGLENSNIPEKSAYFFRQTSCRTYFPPQNCQNSFKVAVFSKIIIPNFGLGQNSG